MKGISLELFFKFPFSYKEKRIKSLVRACSTLMEKKKVFQNHFCSFATSVLGFIYHIICVIGVFISNLAQRDGQKAIQKDLFSFMRG